MKPLKKETNAQRQRREKAESEYPLGRQDRIKEHSECASIEEWQEALFRTANQFTVNVLTGGERHSRIVYQFKDFPKALEKVDEVAKAHRDERTLVYAINPEGRYFCIPQNLWLQYMEIWRTMHPRFQNQIFQLVEGWYLMYGGKIYGPHPSSEVAQSRWNGFKALQ